MSELHRRLSCHRTGSHQPARQHNSHPTGKIHATERLEALLGDAAIAHCGNDQNCVRACPTGIPLTESIAEMNRQVNLYAIKSLFRK